MAIERYDSRTTVASEREDFFLTGPSHLTNVDWKNDDHRRSIAACLVQGVYILERDRQEKREGPQSLAPPWWESFNFKLHSQLVDDADQCIFGAIYEYKAPPENNQFTNQSPRFVIAFRGTLTKGDAFLRDLELDVHIIKNGLHRTSRFEIAIQAVRHVVATFGSSNIWLTGHSLGAAMAMLAGKTKAKMGVTLESFLFNPPFFSAPIEKIKDQKVKQGIRIAGSFMAAGLAVALKARTQKNQQNQQNNQRSLVQDPFSALATWVPNLFVNRSDHICAEYVGYFEHRKIMEGFGMEKIERLATQNSLGSLVMNAIGKGDESDDPVHLIPSANLTVTLDPNEDFRQAHGIHQWWQPDIQLQSTVYNYR